jgi:hypothetical protein
MFIAQVFSVPRGRGQSRGNNAFCLMLVDIMLSLKILCGGFFFQSDMAKPKKNHIFFTHSA